MIAKKECEASTEKGTPCKKRGLPGSRYCLFHQERSAWFMSLFFFVCGSVVTCLTTWYMDRQPSLQATCWPEETNEPAAIECSVKNTGRGEARDVYLSFTKQLPVGTKVRADPELGVSLKVDDVLPDPRLHPKLAEIQKAFSVRLPRVPPRGEIRFQVGTRDEDNVRAKDQILRIRQTIKSVLVDFSKKLAEKYPNEVGSWNQGAVLSARIKEENFYKPGMMFYERGRESILFLTEEEKMVSALHKDLYSRYKKEFIDVFKNRGRFIAPVLKIQTTEGDGAIVVFPPYVESCLGTANVIRRDTGLGMLLEVTPTPPRSYDGDCVEGRREPASMIPGG